MCSTLVQGQPECTADRPAAEVLRWVTDDVMEGPSRKITAVAPRRDRLIKVSTRARRADRLLASYLVWSATHHTRSMARQC